MATRTVYVSLQGTGNSTNLRLRDSEGDDGINDITTNVDPNDVVQWVVDATPPSGATAIYSIQNVYKKQNNDPLNVSLLTADPTNVGNDVLQGTVVSTSPGSGSRERYNIDYKRTSTDSTQTDDPKIQMN